MKNFSLKYLVLLLFSFVLITSCDDDDDEPEVSPFVGDYVISNAQVSEEFIVSINGPGGVPLDIPVAQGTDITEAIQQSLLSQVDCDSPENSWVELRDDYSMYMSCAGANEMSAGTWEEISPTELKLNMNADAIPSSPIGFTLTVTDIAVAGSNMSGFTSVPLPADMVEAMLPGGITLAPGNPPIFMVKFSLTFVKQ